MDITHFDALWSNCTRGRVGGVGGTWRDSKTLSMIEQIPWNNCLFMGKWCFFKCLFNAHITTHALELTQRGHFCLHKFLIKFLFQFTIDHCLVLGIARFVCSHCTHNLHSIKPDCAEQCSLLCQIVYKSSTCSFWSFAELCTEKSVICPNVSLHTSRHDNCSFFLSFILFYF